MRFNKILSPLMTASPNRPVGHGMVRCFQTTILVLALCAATAVAQNTQVTIEGTITSVGSVSGIAVGDKYAMVVYYNPTQSPATTVGSGDAYYTGYTLSAVIDDKNGNQTFTADSGEQLFVQDVGGDQFISTPCCSATGAGFVLIGNSSVFTSYALPTALTLADFNLGNYVAIGSGALGNITSVKVDNTAGVIPAFITAGFRDPNGKVPTLNGVPGSGVNNLDIAQPLTTLVHGTSYVYTIALQDVNFSGPCKTSFKLTQVQYNMTVTLDSQTNANFTCVPAGAWAWAFIGKTIPDFPGPATLTGTVTYGSSTSTTSTTVIIE
jgi:hypothetical protein